MTAVLTREPFDIKPLVSAALRAARKETGRSQRETAEIIGVKQAQYAVWESGKIEIGLTNFIKVTQKLGFEPGAFLTVVLEGGK